MSGAASPEDQRRRPRRRPNAAAAQIAARAQGNGQDALPTMPSSVLVCRAAHPGEKRNVHRYRGRIHERELQIVPFLVEPTGRILTSFSDVDTEHGCLGVKCASDDCRLITEYRVVAPPTPSATTA